MLLLTKATPTVIVALVSLCWRYVHHHHRPATEKNFSSSWPVPKSIVNERYIYIYIYIYLLTYLLTPRSRVLLEKLSGSKPVKNFPAFYGTRRFITAHTSAHHLSISWARSIQSVPPHPTSWRSILILSSHLRLGLPSGLVPLRFPHQNPVHASPLSHTCYMPRPSHLSRFYHPQNFGIIHYIWMVVWTNEGISQ